jgi:predicted RNA-binding protein with PUA domain
MSHQPWWWRSKCRPLGVTMPNSDCSGANDTEDCVRLRQPGLWRRCTMEFNKEFDASGLSCPLPIVKTKKRWST